MRAENFFASLKLPQTVARSTSLPHPCVTSKLCHLCPATPCPFQHRIANIFVTLQQKRFSCANNAKIVSSKACSLYLPDLYLVSGIRIWYLLCGYKVSAKETESVALFAAEI